MSPDGRGGAVVVVQLGHSAELFAVPGSLHRLYSTLFSTVISNTKVHLFQEFSFLSIGRSNFFDPPGNGNGNESLLKQVLSLRIKCYLSAKTIHLHIKNTLIN